MEPSRPQHQCEPGSVRQPAWPYLTLLIERQLLPKEEILGYSELWERTPVVTNRSRSPNSSETAQSRVRIEVRSRSMPNGLYRQSCGERTWNRPLERTRCKEIESTAKPDFSDVYATQDGISAYHRTLGQGGHRDRLGGRGTGRGSRCPRSTAPCVPSSLGHGLNAAAVSEFRLIALS
jgi:hypothetical protein